MYTVKPRTTHLTTSESFDKADLLDSEFVLNNYRASGYNLQWDSKEEALRIAFGHHRGALQLSPDYFQVVKEEDE